MSNWGDDWGEPITSSQKDSSARVPTTAFVDQSNHTAPIQKSRPENGWHADQKTWVEGEKNDEIEKELFNNTDKVNTGINFAEMTSIPIKVAGEDPPDAISEFSQAKLHPFLLSNIVDNMKYEDPTPIQAISIPVIADSRDLMACAQTGSGKTASYLIPIMDKLLKRGKSKFYTEDDISSAAKPLALIIVPTRELANQVFTEARKFAYKSWVQPAVIYGGADTNVLRAGISRGAHILVATTGKLKDFLNRGLISLSKLKFLVIDEADRLLSEGFEEDIFEIVQGHDMPNDESRQTAMFSATFAKDVRRVARELLDDCILVTVGSVGKVPKDIVQKVEWVDSSEKRDRLLDILYDQEAGQVIIFVNGIRFVDALDDFLYRNKFPITSIHSKRSQAEREDSIAAFRNNVTPILIATDIAARGLDIPNVVHVINYDLPPTIDEYIHRIGRTARVGNQGLATSFFNDRDYALSSDLAKVLVEAKQEIPEFLKEYADTYIDQVNNGDTAVVENELREEDFEGELPEHHIPLNQRKALVEERQRNIRERATQQQDGQQWGTSKPAVNKGDSWGTSEPAASKGDSWGTSDPATSKGDSWGTSDPATSKGDSWGTSESAASKGDSWGTSEPTPAEDSWGSNNDDGW